MKAAPRVTVKWVAVLLVSIALCALLVELGMRSGFARISRIGKRQREEYLAARALRRESSPNVVLLTGNSLLLEGVDLPVLQRGLPAGIHAARFVIEQTEYLDWLYGIKRLFAEGSRPALVVLAIGPDHLVADGMLLDSAPYYLYDLRDLPAIARLQHLNLTESSSMYFAHWSLFFAQKNGLRNFIMGKADPPYAAFLHELGMHPAHEMTRAEVMTIAAPRFREIDELCREYGAGFAYLMPPGFVPNEDAFRAAAADAKVAVIAPVRQFEWPRSKFRDGFHLKPESAIQFATLLAPALTAVDQAAHPTNH